MKKTRIKPRELKPQILLERQDGDSNIYLWCDHELIRQWRGKYSSMSGAPLDYARALIKAFRAVHIEAEFECSDPEIAELFALD